MIAGASAWVAILHPGFCLPSENICQRDKTLDWNFFGSGRRVDIRFGEERSCVHTQCLETLPKHFAALAEGSLRNTLERHGVAGERFLPRRKAHDR